MKLKLISTLLFLVCFMSSFAQNSWSNLSPNQKIKLAKKEQKAAKKDKEYLQLMEEALQFFQEGEFEKAKEKYEAAHLRRPDNVYPMVMLDDIQIAQEIDEEEEEIVEEEIVEEEIVEEIPIVLPPIVEEEITEDLTEENSVEPNIQPPSEESIVVPVDSEIEIRKTQKPALQPERKEVITHEAKVYKEDGTFFSTFKEGSATVEQIEIVVKGAKTSYRKVSHSWGAVYYFKNEDSITKEEWTKIYDEAKKD